MFNRFDSVTLAKVDIPFKAFTFFFIFHEIFIKLALEHEMKREMRSGFAIFIRESYTALLPAYTLCLIDHYIY